MITAVTLSNRTVCSTIKCWMWERRCNI